MIRRRAALLAALIAIILAATLIRAAFVPAGMPAGAIGGVGPHYGPEMVAAVPNERAIARRFWVPELDAGYDPQGLAVIDGALLVSAFRSTEFEVNRGPCRVFRLDPDSGRETGQVDVPAPCGHAGGLAVADGEALYIADTHTLFAVPLREAFAGEAPLFRRIPLGPGLVGALATATPGAIWSGTYREDGLGRLYRFSGELLARLTDGETLQVADAVTQLAIPSYAQGAAFDRTGKLWVARSHARWGELDRLDSTTGAVERRYATAPGIEGIAFDSRGLMWAVSEAGARHVYDNFFAALVMPFFPLVFAIDPARLE